MNHLEKEKYSSRGVRITLWGLFINIFLGLGKCVIGFFGNSLALFGDGLHSFLDMASDCAVLFGLKISVKPEDKNHHYGHYKFSSLATLFVSFILIVFCLGLIFSSVRSLLLDEVTAPSVLTIWAAVVSLVVKEVLFWRTRLVAKELKSKLLMANAWHHRADSWSSVMVLVSLLFSYYGGEDWVFADKIVGVILGIYLGRESLKYLWESSEDLLDTAPGGDIVNDIREHILPTPGVISYHKFRVRTVGDFYEVDMHLQVDPEITVEQGHMIASKVKHAIIEKHPSVVEVLVHIEPAKGQHMKSLGINESNT